MNVNFSPAKQRADEIKYLGHSDEHLALQEHSIDDLYPWSVVVVTTGRNGGYCFPKNLVGGQTGKRFSYVSEGIGDRPIINTFEKAYAAAEQWIRDHRGLCVTQQPTAADIV